MGVASEDKHAAARALIDPLIEPEPSAVDGPGTHFTQPQDADTFPSPDSPRTSGSRKSTNPFRRNPGATGEASHSRHGSVEKTGAAVRSRHVSSASQGGRRARATSDLGHDGGRTGSGSRDPPPQYKQRSPEPAHNRPRRSSSLRERYPGDSTHEPLQMLRRDSRKAHRSPHLQRHHQPLPDQIDVLDQTATKYHHEGPYDAALLVRNSSFNSSPVAALDLTNREAIKATPKDKIRDSLFDHRPLDGTAMIPPGHRDAFGNVYNYEEGADLMREPGADYKRWPGLQYHPDDLKGKGEPSYSIEKALKAHDEASRRHQGDGDGDGTEYELVERPKPSQEPEAAETTGRSHDGRRRSGHSHKLSDGVKRRAGSLRKKNS